MFGSEATLLTSTDCEAFLSTLYNLGITMYLLFSYFVVNLYSNLQNQNVMRSLAQNS